MARPKAFDRDTALNAAIGVFAEQGYEGASTSALLHGMGISRQSLYDTFGDKRSLYLEALQTYTSGSVAALTDTLTQGSSPLRSIEAAVLAYALQPAVGKPSTCLGVSAVCEFGRNDAAVNQITDISARSMTLALERRLRAAQGAGEIAAAIDIPTAAQFLVTTLSGLKVAARGGTPPETLTQVVRMALRSLA
jgi:AcrR family transcriptional regulator